jgi:hypothetical protein
LAQKQCLLGFNQIKVEPDPRQMAVHLDVRWVSRRALEGVWTEMGFAVA